MSSKKVQCIGRICGTEQVPGTMRPKKFYSERCSRACAKGSNLCALCLNAEKKVLEGELSYLESRFQGRKGGPIPEGARAVTPPGGSMSGVAAESAMIAAEIATAAAASASNAAAAVSGTSSPAARTTKKAATAAKSAAKVATARAKTAAELEAEALMAQLQAIKERAKAEREAEAAAAKAKREAEAAAAKAKREAEATAKKVAREAEATAKKADMEAKKAAREAEEAAKKAAREAEKAVTGAEKVMTPARTTRRNIKKITKGSSTRRASSSNRRAASASPSPRRSAAASGYATPYSGSPGSNAYRYNLVKVPRMASAAAAARGLSNAAGVFTAPLMQTPAAAGRTKTPEMEEDEGTEFF